jgi:nuclear pore complex protein Nup85
VKASVFFLGVLSRHPSQYLQPFAERMIPLVGSQPRIKNFQSEKDFVYASRRWNDKIKAIRVDMDHVPETERSDAFDNWWDRLSDIVAVLEGRGDVLERVCEDNGADWKEVVAAWSIFVEPRMRREGLPSVAPRLTHAHLLTISRQGSCKSDPG